MRVAVQKGAGAGQGASKRTIGVRYPISTPISTPAPDSSTTDSSSHAHVRPAALAPASAPEAAPVAKPSGRSQLEVIKAVDGRTYHVGKRLGAGSFGEVFEVTNDVFGDGRRLCVKLETVEPGKDSLMQNEQRAYAHLARSQGACPFFPRADGLLLSDDGKTRILVLDKGGQDLLTAGRRMTDAQRLRCLRHAVTALKYMHDECGLLHRDIKPENILIGCHAAKGAGNAAIMIVDMGFVKRFRYLDPATGRERHIPLVTGKTSLHGTPNYASTHTLDKVESSRRDDLESLVYTFVVIFDKHHLPWGDVAEDYARRQAASGGKLPDAELWRMVKMVADIKHNSTPADVTGLEIPCLLKMCEHVRRLAFDERPDYESYIQWITDDERRALGLP